MIANRELDGSWEAAGAGEPVISSRSLISALARGPDVSWVVPGAWELPGKNRAEPTEWRTGVGTDGRNEGRSERHTWTDAGRGGDDSFDDPGFN